MKTDQTKHATPQALGSTEGLGAGSGALAQFDVVTATFQPIRRDDLKGHAVYWVGRRLRWEAAWIVEPEDGGPYVGQWAMTPKDNAPPGLQPIGWVPLCDLVDVEAPNVRAHPGR